MLARYYGGLFGRPMWFSSLLIAFTLFFWIYILTKYSLKSALNKEEELSIILLVPFTICALHHEHFFKLGITGSMSNRHSSRSRHLPFCGRPRVKVLKYPPAMALAMGFAYTGAFLLYDR